MADWEYALLLFMGVAIYSTVSKLSKSENSIGISLRRFWEKRIIHVWTLLLVTIIVVGGGSVCIIYYYFLNYIPSIIFTLLTPIGYLCFRHEFRKVNFPENEGLSTTDKVLVFIVSAVVVFQFFSNFLFSLSLYGMLVLVQALRKNRTFSKVVVPAEKIPSVDYREELHGKFEKLRVEEFITPEINYGETPDSAMDHDNFASYEGISEELCSICHEPVKEGKLHRCQSCATAFHKNCILLWVQGRDVSDRRCPRCHGNLGYI